MGDGGMDGRLRRPMIVPIFARAAMPSPLAEKPTAGPQGRHRPLMPHPPTRTPDV
jgi:hypothetical protein